jgi:hypothetical protein
MVSARIVASYIYPACLVTSVREPRLAHAFDKGVYNRQAPKARQHLLVGWYRAVTGRVPGSREGETSLAALRVAHCDGAGSGVLRRRFHGDHCCSGLW